MEISKEILLLIKDRNEKGITLLYDHYANALLGMAYRIIGDRSIAEESLNKSFLKIWNNIDSYNENKGALFTWMSQITKNTALDVRRSKSFVQDRKTDSISNYQDQLGSTETNSSGLDVENLLKNLDEKYKIVLEYLYLKGYTQKELSEELNIPIGTIKTRLRKAIEILRTNLGSETNLSNLIQIILILIMLNISLWII